MMQNLQEAVKHIEEYIEQRLKTFTSEQILFWDDFFDIRNV